MKNSGLINIRKHEFPSLYQGFTNGCGTTCLAMVLSHLLECSISREIVDAHIRRFDIFTSPGDIARLARSFGVQAVMINHTTMQELKDLVLNNNPAIAMIRSSRSLHYVVIYNLQIAAAGTVTHFLFADPATGNHRILSTAEFQKTWGNLPGGFHQFSIFFSRENYSMQYLPNRLSHVRFVLPLLDSLTAASNTLHHVFTTPNRAAIFDASVRLPFEILKAILMTPFALFSALVSTLDGRSKILNT